MYVPPSRLARAALTPASPSATQTDAEHVGRADALLDDPVLADLRHGTIRYRKEDMARAESVVEGTAVRSGYFYHARLHDNTPGEPYAC